MKTARYITYPFLVWWFIFGGLALQSNAGEIFELTIYVNSEDGFHKEDGEILNNSVWKVAKGTQVEIVFKFAGEMDLIEEEEHEIHMKLLRYENGEKPEMKLIVQRLKPLSPTNLKVVIKFTAGEFSENILKIFCITDCDGMDFMDDLRIEVI